MFLDFIYFFFYWYNTKTYRLIHMNITKFTMTLITMSKEKKLHCTRLQGLHNLINLINIFENELWITATVVLME